MFWLSRVVACQGAPHIFGYRVLFVEHRLEEYRMYQQRDSFIMFWLSRVQVVACQGAPHIFGYRVLFVEHRLEECYYHISQDLDTRQLWTLEYEHEMTANTPDPGSNPDRTAKPWLHRCYGFYCSASKLHVIPYHLSLLSYNIPKNSLLQSISIPMADRSTTYRCQSSWFVKSVDPLHTLSNF